MPTIHHRARVLMGGHACALPTLQTLSPRHCERSEAIHLSAHKGVIDCSACVRNDEEAAMFALRLDEFVARMIAATSGAALAPSRISLRSSGLQTQSSSSAKADDPVFHRQ